MVLVLAGVDTRRTSLRYEPRFMENTLPSVWFLQQVLNYSKPKHMAYD
jgi:hypothetical protein